MVSLISMNYSPVEYVVMGSNERADQSLGQHASKLKIQRSDWSFVDYAIA